jgi:hypothetical protein
MMTVVMEQENGGNSDKRGKYVVMVYKWKEEYDFPRNRGDETWMKEMER